MKYEHLDVAIAVVAARAMLCVAASIPNFNDLPPKEQWVNLHMAVFGMAGVTGPVNLEDLGRNLAFAMAVEEDCPFERFRVATWFGMGVGSAVGDFEFSPSILDLRAFEKLPKVLDTAASNGWFDDIDLISQIVIDYRNSCMDTIKNRPEVLQEVEKARAIFVMAEQDQRESGSHSSVSYYEAKLSERHGKLH